MGKREYSIIKNLSEIAESAKKAEDGHNTEFALEKNRPSTEFIKIDNVEGNVSINVKIYKGH